MASWTTPVIHATGDIFAVTDNNTLANDLTFLYQAPYIGIYNTVSVSTTNETITQITLGGLSFSGYGWSVSSNNAICPLTGMYSVSFSSVFTTASSGVNQGYLYHNGSIVLNGALAPLNGSFYSESPASGLVRCSASDTLGLWAQQNSGGNLGTVTGASYCMIHAFFVGSQ